MGSDGDAWYGLGGGVTGSGKMNEVALSTRGVMACDAEVRSSRARVRARTHTHTHTHTHVGCGVLHDAGRIYT